MAMLETRRRRVSCGLEKGGRYLTVGSDVLGILSSPRYDFTRR